MTNLQIEPFSFQKTFLIALMGAIIGQTIIILISWGKRQIDLHKKKKMILLDLENHYKTLEVVSTEFNKLNQIFSKQNIDTFSANVFQTLQLDIYESLPKHELYSIFKKDLHELVDIYKTIQFIQKNGPYYVWCDYLEQSNQHRREKENDPTHIERCEKELGFIDVAKKNIQSHVATISEVRIQIEKLILEK